MQNKETNRQNGAEQRIRQLLAEGKKKEAVAIIMKYIEALASKKMFAKAESLRNTLIKIDSMMLKEIVKAAEIIEEHKAAAIDPEHLRIWADLRELLEKEEFSALYHSINLQRCRNGEIIVEQGTLRPQLIFINSGKVQVFTSVDGREVPIKHVGAGEVIGGGTFFDPSVWTTSVRSLTAEIFLFPRRHMNQLKSQYPSLESKLFDFSARFTSANTIFRESRKSRRQYKRKTIAGRATAALLKNDGGLSGVAFKGDLFDISRGGISFCARISKKEKANLLFGTKIRVGVPPGQDRIAGADQLTYAGKIVAVRAHHAVGNEYSIHVEFDKILSSGELQRVLSTN